MYEDESEEEEESIEDIQQEENESEHQDGGDVKSNVMKENFSCIAEMPRAHTGDVNCVAWHPSDGGCIASAGDDYLVRIWRIKTLG